MVERSLSMREVPGSIPGTSKYFLSNLKKNILHRPGIEPGPPAWQASILPLNQRCYRISSPKKPRAAVAEWLTRLTRNQFPSGSVGSNPTDCEFFPISKYCFNIDFYFDLIPHASIVGSVVECSPATRAARVRFPDDAVSF